MSDEKNKFPSTFVEGQFVKYIDSKEINGIVETIGNTLSQKYQGQDLVLIGVLKGSMVFLADLVREIKGVKVYVDFVKLQAIGRSKENHGTICISKDFKKSLGPKQMSQKQMSTQANLPVRLWRVAACSQHISYSFRGGRFQMGVRWQ